LIFIYLNGKHINETTIKVFIEKALNNPKTYYKFIALQKRFTNNSISINLLILKEKYFFLNFLFNIISKLEFIVCLNFYKQLRIKKNKIRKNFP